MAEEKILDKVRKLLERAGHPNTPEAEREACLAMADKLMVKHAIDEAILDSTRSESDRRKPVKREFRAADPDGVWYIKFRTILAEIGRTVRVRVGLKWNGDVVVVGYADDVQYYEDLWTRIYFDFLSKLDPKWNHDLSFEHNVYNFKKAGTKWEAIRNIAVANGHWVDWPDGGALIRAYKRHCRIIGEEPQNHTQRHAAYRESFAEGFTAEICRRLEQMRADAAEQAGESGALVLYDARQAIDDMWYDLYPKHHPDYQRKIMEEYEAEKRRQREEHEAWLASLTAEQRARWEKEQEIKRQREAREKEKYWRQQAKESSRLWDSAGRQAGRRAGQESDLSRSNTGVRTDKRGELG
jgi:hypothetical protein